MPQWSRNRSLDADRYPDERLRAACSAEARDVLTRYDHHVVWVQGRTALLLTLHLAQDADAALAARGVEISFTYPRGHPKAPVAVQRIVDGLAFRPIDK